MFHPKPRWNLGQNDRNPPPRSHTHSSHSSYKTTRAVALPCHQPLARTSLLASTPPYGLSKHSERPLRVCALVRRHADEAPRRVPARPEAAQRLALGALPPPAPPRPRVPPPAAVPTRRRHQQIPVPHGGACSGEHQDDAAAAAEARRLCWLPADAHVGAVAGAAGEAPAPARGRRTEGPAAGGRRRGGHHAQGAGGRVRGRRGRVDALRGPRGVLQPPALRGAAARGRGGVRLPAPRRDHHPVRGLAVRARRRRGRRRRRRRRREEGAFCLVVAARGHTVAGVHTYTRACPSGSGRSRPSGGSRSIPMGNGD
jgi:hypothetical protein